MKREASEPPAELIMLVAAVDPWTRNQHAT